MDLEQLNKKYVGKTYVTKEDANSNKNQENPPQFPDLLSPRGV